MNSSQFVFKAEEKEFAAAEAEALANEQANAASLFAEEEQMEADQKLAQNEHISEKEAAVEAAAEVYPQKYYIL